MFPDPVPAVTRAVDEMTKWCAAHPEDSLAQVTLGQFEELKGDRESVNRRLYQVLVNESKGIKNDDAMLLWAQLAIICDFDGWINRTYGIPTPVKSEAAAPQESTRSTGGVKTGAATVSSKVTGQVNALPLARKVAFLAAAGATVVYLLRTFANFSHLFLALAAALLGIAIAVVLWLVVLGRMPERRKAAVLLVGGLVVEMALGLLFGGRGFGNFLSMLAGLAFNFAYLVIAYLTYKDALKGSK